MNAHSCLPPRRAQQHGPREAADLHRAPRRRSRNGRACPERETDCLVPSCKSGVPNPLREKAFTGNDGLLPMEGRAANIIDAENAARRALAAPCAQVARQYARAPIDAGDDVIRVNVCIVLKRRAWEDGHHPHADAVGVLPGGECRRRPSRTAAAGTTRMRTWLSRCRFCANTMPTSTRQTSFMRSQLRYGSGLSTVEIALQNDVGEQRSGERLRKRTLPFDGQLQQPENEGDLPGVLRSLDRVRHKTANRHRKKKMAPSSQLAPASRGISSDRGFTLQRGRLTASSGGRRLIGRRHEVT